MDVTIVGGGVAGLGAAVALARRGIDVTVLERDPTPMPGSADEAFEWDRRGAPQVRHSHAFLALLHNLLRDEYPDVLAALLAEGAVEMRFGDELPPTLTGFEPERGDADLTMLACRRTTFEWVLRRAALAEGRVEVRTGVAVDGLVGTPSPAPGEPAVVRGVRTADVAELRADVVVVATGRRSVAPEWLAALGAAEVHETVEDTGIVYLSRFYRLRPDRVAPPRSGPIGGDLGYLKYGVFAGDNRTFSITLAVPTVDDELRRLLSDPATFDDTARQLTATAPWLDGRAEAITPQVHVMAGLLNRWRDVVVDGEPIALGLHLLGDARVCTNPLYGRGCALAFQHAHLLAGVIDSHREDPRAQALAFEALTRQHLHPWYRASVDNDAEARRVAAALLAGEDPDADTGDPRTMMRAVLRDGLAPAIRTDPVVLRAFVRTFNLLAAPDALMTDPEVIGRVLAVWQDRDARPPEPPLGPSTRADLLATLTAA
jgi:2-polyprenyl-6-methoxyphenol hydroxylase-like FAD-dependent oxidoreductase